MFDVEVPEMSAKFRVTFGRTLVVLDKSDKTGFKFQESNALPCPEKFVGVSIATTCRIFRYVNDDKRELIVHSKAVCDTRDVFDKSKGRKKALGNALDIFVDKITLKELARKIRRCFWMAYFKQVDRKILDKMVEATS